MLPKYKSLKITGILLLLFSVAYGQSPKTQQGVILKKGTTIRIANASIYNKRAGHAVTSNNLGMFSILAFPGDVLQINHHDYTSVDIVLSTFKDTLVYLRPSATELAEVIITNQSGKFKLREAEDSFRKKGIYYKGRPPLLLLSPFGGSPLTFFHELLSKDGKRARRFYKFSESEYDYYEVVARFNDITIKRIVPIKDEELTDFKSQYWPTVEQVRTWADIDLFMYIKSSYQAFLKNKKVEN